VSPRLNSLAISSLLWKKLRFVPKIPSIRQLPRSVAFEMAVDEYVEKYRVKGTKRKETTRRQTGKMMC
jgi:hypothetical protein